MKNFEEFRDKVINAIQEWEVKAMDLSELGAKYYGELEESRRLFLNMKMIVQGKDNLITSLQQTIKEKDKIFEAALHDLRRDLESSFTNLTQDLIAQLN